MNDPVPIRLEPSETAVLHVASRIYAASIIGQRLTEEEDGRLRDRAIRTAIEMAREVDLRVKSDDELS